MTVDRPFLTFSIRPQTVLFELRRFRTGTVPSAYPSPEKNVLSAVLVFKVDRPNLSVLLFWKNYNYGLFTIA